MAETIPNEVNFLSTEKLNNTNGILIELTLSNMEEVIPMLSPLLCPATYLQEETVLELETSSLITSLGARHLGHY